MGTRGELLMGHGATTSLLMRMPFFLYVEFCDSSYPLPLSLFPVLHAHSTLPIPCAGARIGFLPAGVGVIMARRVVAACS